jgi:hypothetical protein
VRPLILFFFLVHPYIYIWVIYLRSILNFSALEVSYLEIFELFCDVVRKMDKSWMKLPRTSREYIRGVMAFVKFVREHENRKWLIVCPCKKYLLGKSWSCGVEFAHLTPGAGIIEGYIEWIMHGESLVPPVDNETIYEAPRTLQVDSIQLHGGPVGCKICLLTFLRCTMFV